MNQAQLLQQAEKVSSLLRSVISQLLDGKSVRAYRYAEEAESEIKEVVDRLRVECPSCGGLVEWEYHVAAPDHYIGTCEDCGKDFNVAIQGKMA